MGERRGSPRIPGSALPWLSVSTTRAADVDVLDISTGGALIQTAARITPGERDVVLLRGQATIRVIAHAQHVHVAGLRPCVSYRTGISFATPIALEALGFLEPAVESDAADATPSDFGSLVEGAHDLADRFASWIRELSGVHAVRVGTELAHHPGIDGIHFPVPDSSYGAGRRLQVLFSPGAQPTAADFVRLQHLATVASSVPDLDISRKG